MQTQTAPVSREQLKQQIQQTVRDAQVAAEKAAREAVAAQEGAGARPGTIVIPVPPTPPGAPGTTVQWNPNDMIPARAESISIAFFVMIAAIIIGLPLMRAIARRIDRGAPAPVQFPNELKEQLNHLAQSVDAIAIEVERISEGQRFTTKMLADKPREGTVLTPGAQQ
jgi:hypothetical protein